MSVLLYLFFALFEFVLTLAAAIIAISAFGPLFVTAAFAGMTLVRARSICLHAAVLATVETP